MSDSLYRKLQLLSCLPFEQKRSMSVKQICDKLDQSYFEDCKSARSRERKVQRDLKKFRDVGMILETPQSTVDSGESKKRVKPCYYIDSTQLPNFLPPIEPSDAIKLHLSSEFLKYLLPTTPSSQEGYLYEKASEYVNHPKNRKYAKWESKVAVAPPLISVKYKDVNEKVFAELQKHLFDEKRCEITYSVFHKKKIKTYQIEPLGLVVRDSKIICFAKSQGIIKQFLCHRITKVLPLYQPFHYPSDFSLRDYIKSGVLNYIQSESNTPDKVVLHVKAHPRIMLEEGELFDGQKLKNIDDTWCEVQFSALHTKDFEAWLMAYCNDIKIIQPLELKQRVQALLSEGLSHFTEG